MTAAVSNIPVSIDYTSRDFYAVREELINLVKARTNIPGQRQWSGEDPSDFGVALVEAFAYIADLNNYYIDRIANESYLPTASQRKSIINLAGLYGYKPTGYRAATCAVEFTNESETDDYVLPVGTQISAEVICNDVVEEVIFTTLEEATVATGGTISVYAKHGEDISTRTVGVDSSGGVTGELIGTSNGSVNQQFVLSENQVVEGTVKVYVMAGDVYEPWTEVEHLADYGPADPVYRTYLDENNFVYVVFGDGISGSIPNNLSGIKAVYSVGGGTIGNIATELLNTIIYVPGLTSSQLNALSEFVTVTNITVGIGGAEPEDNRSLRNNASKAIRAVNRAVSLKDYADFALYATNAGKANAAADIWTAVTLYVAPQRNVNDLDKFPGKDSSNMSTTTEWDELKIAVADLLTDATQIGVSVTIAPPTYVPVSLDVVYSKNAQYSAAQAADDVKKAIVNGFAYAYLDFEQVITPENVEASLNNLSSIRSARVTSLYRTSDGSPSRKALIGDPDEIFVFLESNLVATEASNEARLTGLTSTDGTFSPVFEDQLVGGYADFYVYNLIGVTDPTFTLTPTASAGTTITVNGVSASTPITAPGTGETLNIPIVVIAADGTTVKVYTVSVFGG